MVILEDKIIFTIEHHHRIKIHLKREFIIQILNSVPCLKEEEEAMKNINLSRGCFQSKSSEYDRAHMLNELNLVIKKISFNYSFYVFVEQRYMYVTGTCLRNFFPIYLIITLCYNKVYRKFFSETSACDVCVISKACKTQYFEINYFEINYCLHR